MRVKATEGQMTLEGPGITGAEMRRKAMEWTRRNLRAWSEMKRMAVELASKGRRFSIDQLAIEARYNMRVDGHDDGFKVNNNLRAPLARMLIQECPGVEGYVETRPSKADWC